MIASLAVNRPASSAVCLRRPFVCVLLSLLVNMLPVASQHSSKVARRWQFASRASYVFVCYAARPLVVPVTNRTLSVRPSVPRWRLTQGQKIRFSIQICQIFRVAFLLGSTMMRSRDQGQGQVHQTRRNVPHLISGWPRTIFRKHVQKRGQTEIHVPRTCLPQGDLRTVFHPGIYRSNALPESSVGNKTNIFRPRPRPQLQSQDRWSHKTVASGRVLE